VRGYAVILFLVLGGFAVRAQKQGQPLVDSLERVLDGHPDDTAKVRIYVQLTRVMDGVDPRKAFPYAEKGMALAEKLSFQQGIANLNNSFGLLTGDTGNNAQSRFYFEKSLAINKTLDAKNRIIANLSNIGRSYEREANFTKASEYYFQGLGLAQESGNIEQAALVGTNIMSMYTEEEDYPKARAYGDSTIRWGMQAHALFHVAKAFEMLGVVYLNTGDTPNARKNYDTAFALYTRLGNQIAAVSALSNMATLEPDPQKQLDITRRAQSILDTAAPLSQNSIMNQTNLGFDYLALGESKKGADQMQDFALAAVWLNRADSLSKLMGTMSFEAAIESGMSDLAKDRGNYREALLHFRRYTFINDSIFSQDNKNKIARVESQRAIDLKNQQIGNERLQISNQRKTMWMLVIGVALLGAIGVILWRQSVLRKRTNNELLRLNGELNEANKVKAKFLGILSHDLRSPIARLLNFLTLQKKKPESLNAAEKEEYWERLTGSATTLLETMEAMLLWSKGQMEVFKPRIGTVEVSGIFERLRRFFGDVAGVGFEFSCENGLVVETDEDYLWTIMQNLTANAMLALTGVEGEGGRGVAGARVCWRAWGEGGSVLFSISDNGPGVSEEQLRALYDETIGAGARQGLGLHIVRDLAKAIDCKIRMDSEKGEGTEFVLEFSGGGARERI
jgi:signal transduction histidine kinase